MRSPSAPSFTFLMVDGPPFDRKLRSRHSVNGSLLPASPITGGPYGPDAVTVTWYVWIVGVTRPASSGGPLVIWPVAGSMVVILNISIPIHGRCLHGVGQYVARGVSSRDRLAHVGARGRVLVTLRSTSRSLSKAGAEFIPDGTARTAWADTAIAVLSSPCLSV